MLPRCVCEPGVTNRAPCSDSRPFWITIFLQPAYVINERPILPCLQTIQH